MQNHCLRCSLAKGSAKLPACPQNRASAACNVCQLLQLLPAAVKSAWQRKWDMAFKAVRVGIIARSCMPLGNCMHAANDMAHLASAAALQLFQQAQLVKMKLRQERLRAMGARQVSVDAHV